MILSRCYYKSSIWTDRNQCYQRVSILFSGSETWPIQDLWMTRLGYLNPGIVLFLSKKEWPNYDRCLICHWQPYFKVLKIQCFNQIQNSLYLFLKLQSRIGITLWYRWRLGVSIKFVPDLTTSAQANTTIIWCVFHFT